MRKKQDKNIELISSKKGEAFKFKILFIVIVLPLAMLLLFKCSNYKKYQEHQRLSNGKKNLLLLIEAEDKYYSKTGKHLPIKPLSDNIEVKKKLNWRPKFSCPGCEYGVTVSGMAYTATVRCPLNDGTLNYLGFVKTAPGKHEGIDGPFGKCKSEGIYAGRPLVNTVGPCFKQSHGIMFVISGSKKRLVVKTYPPNASVTVNDVLIGKTSSKHNTISQNYGSFFWAEPHNDPITIKITKMGYHPVKFDLDWDSYTYTAAITLRPKEGR